MSAAAKFERKGLGWRLYLNDYEAKDVVPEFTSLSLHFDRDLPVTVERIDGRQEFFTIGYGYAHIFLGPDQARRLLADLSELFSVEVPE